MDNFSPEKKEPKSPTEVVQLNQKFQLFKPSRTELGVQSDKSPFEPPFYSKIALDTKGLLPSMPNFRIELHSTSLDLKISLYPFDPEKGYTITNDDFNLKERKKSIRKFPKKSNSIRHQEEVWN